MALVIFGFFAFVVATVFWLAWAVMWVMVALFWLAWPLTLLIIAAIAWRAQSRHWQRAARSGDVQPRADAGAASGNRAFEEYREETLRRLDEERQNFGAFLERLRKSKDKEAFDRYMSERRGRNIENMRPALN
jgi:biopolymer transport protein ExbB/TolQ